MAESRVRVVLTAAKEGLTSVLRSAKQDIGGWSRAVTKIAAGIGVVDSFKQFGRFLRGTVQDAVTAYPKLGAAFAGVNDRFAEFRIQSGAALLQITEEFIPALQTALDLAVKLATALPTAWQKLKIFTGQVMNVTSPGSGSGLIASGAVGLATMDARREELAADRAAAAAAREAERTRREREAQQAAADRAQAARERDLIARQRDLTPSMVDRSIPLRGGVQDAQTNEELGLLGSPKWFDEWGEGLQSVLGPLAQFNDMANSTNQILGEMAGMVAVNLAGAYGDFFEQLGAGTATMGDFAKATVKAIAGAAISEGKIGVAKGFAKIAEGLFPYNPAMVASGAGMVAKYGALIAIASKFASVAGGGGGSGGSVASSGGNGGSLSPEGVHRGRATATAGTYTVHVPPGAIIRWNSPEWQDFLAKTYKDAQGRNVVFV